MDFITRSIPFNAFSIHYAMPHRSQSIRFELGISLIGDGVPQRVRIFFIIILCAAHKTKSQTHRNQGEGALANTCNDDD